MSTVSKQDVDKVVNFLYNRHTIATYRSALGELVGKELTTPAIQKVVAGWGSLSQSTITVRMAAVRRLVKYKASIEECDPGVLDNVTIPEGRPPSKRRKLTAQELKSFVLAAENTEELLVAILLFDTGLRAGSVPKIRYSDLDGESFKIVGKNDREVEVFTTKSMRILSRKLQRQLGASEGDHIFTAGGGPVSYKFVLRVFRRLADRAGIEDVVPHSARHTFASRLDEAGLSVIKIAAMMGHADVKTTMRYVHPERGTMKEAVQKIAITGGAA